MISYGKQTISKDDIDAVIKILESDWLTQGPAINIFEDAIKQYFGAKYCSVVSSGTSALHLVSLALNWKPDDIIITTPITFLASANCILYAGATPDFVDIDPNNYTIDVNKLEEKIIRFKKNGKTIKAVIAVDYAGSPCDWKALRSIADQYEIKLINDNCHAMGAEYLNSKKYAARYADIVVQSYHPVKHFTSGEGGSVITNDKVLDEKIKLLRSHGITKRENQLSKNDGPWYYEMIDLGYNYRITDFQSALGTQQLKKLDSFLKVRRSIAKIYDDVFDNMDVLTIPKVNNSNKHAYHLYPLLIDFNMAKIKKSEFFYKMADNGILLQVHYIPIHLQPFYKDKFGYKEGDYPISEKFYKSEVSIPIYPNLKKTEQEYVIDLFLKELDE